MGTACGLPLCGKTRAFELLLDQKLNYDSAQVDSNIPEISDDFKFYNLQAIETKQEGSFQWKRFDRYFGYIALIAASLLKEMEKNKQSLVLENPIIQKVLFNSDEMIFDDNDVRDSLLNECFYNTYRLLSSWYSDDSAKVEAAEISKSPYLMVNVWDIGLNKAVHHFLPILYGYLDKNFPVICLRFPDDCQHLNEPIDTSECKKKNISIGPIFYQFTRAEYLLQFSHLARSVYDTDEEKNAGRKDVCKLIALVQNKNKPYPTTLPNISTEIKKEMSAVTERHKAHSMFHTNPLIIDPCDSVDMDIFKKALDRVAKGKQNPVTIPLSWIFLRCTFFKSGHLYIKKDKLQMYAEKCNISAADFNRFLKLFASAGSIIHIPDIPGFCDYVILNPVDFFHRLNELYYPRFNGDLNYGVVSKSTLRRMFGADMEFFYMVLISCSFAVQIKSERIEYPKTEKTPATAGDCLFLPGIRTGDAMKEKQEKGLNADGEDLVKPQKDSLFVMYNTALQPSHMTVNMIRYLFKENLKYISLVMCQYYNVTKIYFRDEKQSSGLEEQSGGQGQLSIGPSQCGKKPHKVEIIIISHSSMNEIRIKGDKSEATLLKRAIVRAYKLAIDDYRKRHMHLLGFDANIEFALQCCKNNTQYHPLNCSTDCTECQNCCLRNIWKAATDSK